MATPDPDAVVVTHWSEFYDAPVAQLMSQASAREHFAKLSEMQKSAYSIRPAERRDFDVTYPIVLAPTPPPTTTGAA